MKRQSRFFAHLALVAALLLPMIVVNPQHGLAAIPQAPAKPDAQVTIQTIKVLIQGKNRSLAVKWSAKTQGGAVAQSFDVIADIKIAGGGQVARNKTVGGNVNSVVFDVPAALAAKKATAPAGKTAGNATGSAILDNKAKAKDETKGKTVSGKGAETTAGKSKVTPRAASLPGEDDGGKLK